MTKSEKLRIIADAWDGKRAIEVFMHGCWARLCIYPDGWDTTNDEHLRDFKEIFDYEVRIIKPLLTQEECMFLKYIDPSWYLSRGRNGVLGASEANPADGLVGKRYIELKGFPPFEEIKYMTNHYYTIQELLDYYKETNQ